MFGFSFSELIVVAIVALVVMGPKDLPKVLRKLGQYAGKLRRMAADLRAQSGIDDALRTEGLADDIAEIRKLARGEIDGVRKAVDVGSMNITGGTATALALPSHASSHAGDFHVYRDREFPRDGADAGGALPDNAIVYAEGLPRSKLGRDALYMMGDETLEVPPEPERAAFMDAHLEPESHEGNELEGPPEPPAPEAHHMQEPDAPKQPEGTV